MFALYQDCFREPSIANEARGLLPSAKQQIEATIMMDQIKLVKDHQDIQATKKDERFDCCIDR